MSSEINKKSFALQALLGSLQAALGRSTNTGAKYGCNWVQLMYDSSSKDVATNIETFHLTPKK